MKTKSDGTMPAMDAGLMEELTHLRAMKEKHDATKKRGRERQAEHRRKLKNKGLKRVTVWVHSSHADDFRDMASKCDFPKAPEIRRNSAPIAKTPEVRAVGGAMPADDLHADALLAQPKPEARGTGSSDAMSLHDRPADAGLVRPNAVPEAWGIGDHGAGPAYHPDAPRHEARSTTSGGSAPNDARTVEAPPMRTPAFPLK